ncbi:BamA/TamA family outer membrane protein [Gemmatimonadota bacterium]
MRKYLYSIMVTLVVGLLPGVVAAQGFGRNRVQYDHFKWRVLNTPHFQFHYYEGMEDMIEDAARIAERSYAYLSQSLQVDIDAPIPVLLYADHQDFRQTNATATPSEGTQGVTESLKQRMILPMMPTMEEYAHVFTHELVHAFQFEMMGIGNSLNPVQWSPPLWIMEGMAEYYAIGMDSNTEIWLRDVVRQDEYLTLNQMEMVMDQRVYRLGQSLYYYLADTYGRESVRQFFKQTIRRHDWRGAMMEIYSQKPEEISRGWQQWLKDRYADDVARQVEADSIATRIISHEGMIYNLNLTPAISPDGKRIAYVANKNMRDGLYVANTESGEQIQALAYGGRSGSLEMIDLFESTMSWSRDGSTLAFVSSGGAEDVIHLVDSRTGRTRKRLRYDDMSIISAALSPDGSQVVFLGMTRGQRDLYIAPTSGGEARRLTNDIYSYLHPAFSPDGSKIAVATDRGRPTNAAELDFRGYRLALIDPETSAVEMLTSGGFHDVNPVWGPDGNTLAFLSNRTGVPQVYLYDLQARSIRRVTDVAAGVSGITLSSPAISWAHETGTLAFSSFREMGWDIYTMPDPRSAPSHGAAVTGLGTGTGMVPVWEGYDLGDPVTFEDRPYHSRFTADYIFGAGGFASQIGVMGDMVIGFSDMLGNQNITVQLGLYGALERSNLSATYINLSRRLNWGVAVFQQAAALGGFYTSIGGATYLTQTFRGASLLGYYPINTFNRLEGSLDLVHLKQEYLGVDFFGRVRSAEDLGSYSYAQANLGWIHDSALYSFIGPVAGQRFIVRGSQSTGDWNTTTLIGDYRRYLPINRRGTLAWRTMAGTLLTNDGYPFSVGGPSMVHGTEYGQMYGTNLVIQNLEFRYPLLPFLPMQWDILSGAIFADAGAVWDDGFTAEWLPLSFASNLYLTNSIVGAVGAGVRVNLGYFTIFLDNAWPTDFQSGFGSPRFQFAIGTVF